MLENKVLARVSKSDELPNPFAFGDKHDTWRPIMIWVMKNRRFSRKCLSFNR